MAKKAWIERNKRKAETVKKYAAIRAELKAKRDYAGLAKLPRNASPTRVVNRCAMQRPPPRLSAQVRRFAPDVPRSRVERFDSRRGEGQLVKDQDYDYDFDMTDPISDMLTRIRNAGRALLPTVEVPHSRMKESIAAILKKEGYVADVAVEGKPAQDHQDQAEVSGQEKRD